MTGISSTGSYPLPTTSSRLDQLFTKLDTNQDGSVDGSEFVSDVTNGSSGTSVSQSDAEALFKQFDSDNDGTVFGLNADGTKVLGLSLRRASNGASPTGSLAMDRGGDLYGTAYYGGAKGASDSGTVFKVKN